MAQQNVLIGELLDEDALTLEELALACSVEPEWIQERVEAGLINGKYKESTTWFFASTDLVRVRRLLSIERDFDANPELAALVTDLIEEVNRLKQRIGVAELLEDK